MPKPSCATHIPHSIRAHRKRCGLSQQELASLAGITGATLCRYERYQRLPDPKTLFACEVIFGVPLRVLSASLHELT
jgi:transcriptional regulator with XRE-family HTH domain